jgi:hypothetical protein
MESRPYRDDRRRDGQGQNGRFNRPQRDSYGDRPERGDRSERSEGGGEQPRFDQQRFDQPRGERSDQPRMERGDRFERGRRDRYDRGDRPERGPRPVDADNGPDVSALPAFITNPVLPLPVATQPMVNEPTIPDPVDTQPVVVADVEAAAGEEAAPKRRVTRGGRGRGRKVATSEANAESAGEAPTED